MNGYTAPRKLFGSMLIMIAIVTLAACGDDSETGGATPGTEHTPEASAETAEPTTSERSEDIAELAAQSLEGQDGKIRYRYKSSFGQHPDGTWTVVNLEDDSRWDWTTAPEGVNGTTTIIRTEDSFHACGSTDFFGSCEGIDAQEYDTYDFFFTPTREVPRAVASGLDGGTIAALPDETLAGLAAKCYQVESSKRLGDGSDGTESIKLCFSENGILLFQERFVNFADTSLPQAHMMLEAIELSDASESDFQLQWPVAE